MSGFHDGKLIPAIAKIIGVDVAELEEGHVDSLSELSQEDIARALKVAEVNPVLALHFISYRVGGSVDLDDAVAYMGKLRG